jgi:predicted amidohydrolase
MKIALAQIRPRLGQVDHNLQMHLETIERAKQQHLDILVFPELSLTGYNLLDLTYDVARPLKSDEIQTLVQAADGLDIVFGFVEQSPEYRLYNAALYASEQRIQHVHRKVYLPTYGMFDEARYFGNGQNIRSFATRFGRIGLLVCEDMWHPSTTYLMAQDGAQLLVVPSNSPARGMGSDVLGTQESWYGILKSQAQLQGMYILFANRVGTEDGVTFWGGSLVVDPFGQVEGYPAPLFREDLLIMDLDLDKVRQARLKMPVLRDENLDLTIRELTRIRDQRFEEGR